jgi:two-component system chemotaxis response regulator CheB
MAGLTFQMSNKHIVVVGASAGGINALQDLVAGLPKDFPGSVFIVLHIPPYSETQLPAVLTKAGPLKAVLARDGASIERGTIYVAPNDHHLLLERDKIVVVKGPKENRFRPSIDALFRSAAYVYGPAVVGVVLSGTLQDGASGIYTIKRQGGIAIVQDPQDAIHSSLPENVLEFVEADYISKAADIGPLLRVLAENGQQSKKSELSPGEIKRLESEVVIAKNENAFEMGIINMGELTPFTCPECHGTLVRLAEGNILRFRCHTGHAYTASALLEDISESVEEMLWQCVRVMEEKAMLEKNIAGHLQEINHDDASMFKMKADESAERANMIHDFIFRTTPISKGG